MFVKANVNYFLPDESQNKVNISVNNNPMNEAEFWTGLFVGRYNPAFG